MLLISNSKKAFKEKYEIMKLSKIFQYQLKFNSFRFMTQELVRVKIQNGG